MPDEQNQNDRTVRTSSNNNNLPSVDEINRMLETGVQDPLVGQTLANGRYRILEVLGQGGMSIVYKAKQELVDRLVAIKTLKLQLLADPMLIKRFEREIKTLSKLNHPNIVTVYDCVVTDNGQPYFVMDYLHGRSLQELLVVQGRLSPARARDIFLQVCSATDHAHRQGIVHRDLKPANIMLVDLGAQGEDFVKVVDFGLAKLGEDAQRLTQTGELWGSPLYMSPEQCSGYAMDLRSDIYSFGAVMYETLTGHVPFQGSNFLETISKHVNGMAPKFVEIDPSLIIDPQIEQVIMKTLAKNPDDRFQSMADLRNEILRVFPAGDVNLGPVPQPTAGNVKTTNQSPLPTSAKPTPSVKNSAATLAGAAEGLQTAKASTLIKPAPSKAAPVAHSNLNTLASSVIGGVIVAGTMFLIYSFTRPATPVTPAQVNVPPSAVAPVQVPPTVPTQPIAPHVVPTAGNPVAPPTAHQQTHPPVPGEPPQLKSLVPQLDVPPTPTKHADHVAQLKLLKAKLDSSLKLRKLKHLQRPRTPKFLDDQSLLREALGKE